MHHHGFFHGVYSLIEVNGGEGTAHDGRRGRDEECDVSGDAQAERRAERVGQEFAVEDSADGNDGQRGEDGPECPGVERLRPGETADEEEGEDTDEDLDERDECGDDEAFFGGGWGLSGEGAAFEHGVDESGRDGRDAEHERQCDTDEDIKMEGLSEEHGGHCSRV